MEVLLGITKDGDVAFGDFEIRNRNGRQEFTASFHTDTPFDVGDVDFAGRLEWDYLEDIDPSDKLDLCDEHMCAPCDLAETMAEDMDEDELCEMCFDTSMFDDTIYANGSEWKFASACAGQHDLTNEMEIIFDHKVYDKLMYLWHKYHLKALSDTTGDWQVSTGDWQIYETLCKEAEHWNDMTVIEETLSDYIEGEDYIECEVA